MTEEKLDEFLDFLSAHGWRIERKDTPLMLNEGVRRRYHNIPADYEMFLNRVLTARAPGNQAGFWGGDDFNDEYERETFGPWFFEGYCIDMEESCRSIDPERSEQTLDRIRTFWNSHFPIALAAHSEYACLSISLLPEDYGSVVYTSEMYYDPKEGCSRIGNSFEQLLDRMRHLIEKGEPGDEDWEIDVWDFVLRGAY